MALIPKKTKYRLSFRPKTKGNQAQQFQGQPVGFSQQSLIKNAWFDQLTIDAKLYDRRILDCKDFFTLPLLTQMTTLDNQKKLFTQSQTSKKSMMKELPNSFDTTNHESESFFLPPVTVLNKHIVQQLRYTGVMIEKPGFDQLLFGTSGICFLEKGTVTTKYIDTIRLLIARQFKKKSRFWIRLSTDTPVTARPAETRMGKGKGTIDHWEAKVTPGQIFIEFSGVDKADLYSLFKQISYKSSMKLKLLSK